LKVRIRRDGLKTTGIRPARFGSAKVIYLTGHTMARGPANLIAAGETGMFEQFALVCPNPSH